MIVAMIIISDFVKLLVVFCQTQIMQSTYIIEIYIFKYFESKNQILKTQFMNLIS